MKHMAHTLIASSLLILALAPSTQAQEWHVDTGLLLGEKQLDSEDWGNHEIQGSIGLLMDFRTDNMPVAIAVDLFGTGHEDTSNGKTDNASSVEMHLGARYLLATGTGWTPYAGAGVAVVSVQEEHYEQGKKHTPESSGCGWWVGAGVRYNLNDSFYLMADVRHSKANVEMNNVDLEAGGTNAGMGLGYHW
jgi:opacity protein-like surface antigen